jgi:hypothetical protein
LTVVCSPTIRPAPAPAPARTIDSPAADDDVALLQPPVSVGYPTRVSRRKQEIQGTKRRRPRPPLPSRLALRGYVRPIRVHVRTRRAPRRTRRICSIVDARNDTSVHTVRLLRVNHHRHLDWTRRGRSGQRCESTAPPDTIIRRTVRYRATKSRRPITGDWDSLRPAAVSAAATTYQPGNQLLATGPKALLNHHHQMISILEYKICM